MFRVPAKKNRVFSFVVYFVFASHLFRLLFFAGKILSCVPVTCTRLSGGGRTSVASSTQHIALQVCPRISTFEVRARERERTVEESTIGKFPRNFGDDEIWEIEFRGGGAIRFPSSFSSSSFPTQFHFEFPLRFKCISNCRQRRIREYVRKKVWRTINSSSLHRRRITHCNDPPGLSSLKSGPVLINFEPRAHFGFPDKFLSPLLLPTHPYLAGMNPQLIPGVAHHHPAKKKRI